MNEFCIFIADQETENRKQGKQNTKRKPGKTFVATKTSGEKQKKYLLRG